MPGCGYVVVVALPTEITDGSSMTYGNGMSLCCFLSGELLLASLTPGWR